MKSLIFTLTAFMFLVTTNFAQNTGTNDYYEIKNWWINYYGNDKEAAYQVLDQMADKIREDFPIDPQIITQINTIGEEYEKREEELLQQAGISYDEFKELSATNPEDPLIEQMESLWTEQSERTTDLRRDYDNAFRERYYTALREAMNRLQENAEAMKNR